MNISYYVELVRARLYDENIRAKDQYGNEVEVPSYRYTEGQIISYLEGSVRRFNLLFNKKLDLVDDEIYKFTDLIVHGAIITALASKALSECGREFSMQDGEIIFTPPAISSLLMHQWEVESADYDRKIKFLLSQYDFSDPIVSNMP